MNVCVNGVCMHFACRPDMKDWVDVFCRELGFSKPGERVGAAHTYD